MQRAEPLRVVRVIFRHRIRDSEGTCSPGRHRSTGVPQCWSRARSHCATYFWTLSLCGHGMILISPILNSPSNILCMVCRMCLCECDTICKFDMYQVCVSWINIIQFTVQFKPFNLAQFTRTVHFYESIHSTLSLSVCVSVCVWERERVTFCMFSFLCSSTLKYFISFHVTKFSSCHGLECHCKYEYNMSAYEYEYKVYLSVSQ